MKNKLTFYVVDSSEELIDEDMESAKFLKEDKEFLSYSPMSKIIFSAAAITLSTTTTLQASEKRNAKSDKIDYKVCQADYISDYLQEEDDYFNNHEMLVLSHFENLQYLRTKVLTEILSFKSLKNSWDGYGAIPAEIKVTAHTIDFLNKLDAETLKKLDEVSPNPHGTISVYFKNRSNESVEVEIGNDLFSYYVDFNNIDTTYIDNLNFNGINIKKLIEKIKYL